MGKALFKLMIIITIITFKSYSYRTTQNITGTSNEFINLVDNQKSQSSIYKNKKKILSNNEIKHIVDSSRNRDFSLYCGIGLIESIVIGVKVQVTNKLSVGFKSNIHVYQAYIVPAFATGLGAIISYLLKKDLFLNVINFEYSYLYNNFSKNSEYSMPGKVLEINAGNESRTKEGYWYWNFGVISTYDRKNVNQVFPSFKIGLIWNMKF